MNRRRIGALGAGVLASLVIASSALGFECTNLSKSDPAAGAQIILGPGGQIIWVSPGLAQRLERGLVDVETGEGYHGIAAFDIDGDGIADISTYVGVGPDGEIPLEAQFRGPACRGLSNLGIYFSQCIAT